MAEVQQLVDMGFPEADARRALQQGMNVAQAVESLLATPIGGVEEPAALRSRVVGDVDDPAQGFGLTQPSPHIAGGVDAGDAEPAPVQRLGSVVGEDRELNAALEMSMREHQNALRLPSASDRDAAVLASAATSLEAVAKEHNLPCGLRNIGNTCYVNSFLQTLLHIDEFRDRILRYRNPTELVSTGVQAKVGMLPEPEAEHAAGKEDAVNASRCEHCVRLAGELRHLFAYGLFTMRSCMDPTRLLNELVDERGQKLPIGSQEDVGEFMLKFLDRLDEGLCAGSFSDVDPAKASDAAAADVLQPADAAAAIEPAASEVVVPEPEAPPTDPLPGDASAASNSEMGAAASTGEAPQQTEVLPMAAATMAPMAAATEEPKDDPEKVRQPSLLQALFFGQQVQLLSYRDCHISAAGGQSAAVDGAVAGSSTDAQGAAPASLEAPVAEGVPPATPEVVPPGLQLAEIPPTGVPPAMDAVTEGVPAVGPEDQGSLVVSEEKNEFLQIFLNVRHKDLYSAWEAANCGEVDYTTASGSKTTASSSFWIERLPKLLSFQLQRVIYDQEKKVQVKVDESFEFDLTIYVDRFLLPNRAEAGNAAARVRELRQRRDELLQALCRFKEYQGRPGLGAEEVLGWAADCLEANALSPQAVDNSSSGSRPQLELCDPHRIAAGRMPEAVTLLGELQQAAPQAVQILRSLKAVCHSQEALLQQEVETLTAEIGDAYRDLRQHPYELHAIWVHQGIAGSGHYWAYVRDWQNDRWIRYDDALVSVKAWEDVRAEAVGQAGSNTSAYVLVYLDKELAVQQSRARDAVEELRAAEAALPRQLLAEIHLDNTRLQEEKAQQEERMAEQELRQHAEAIFQHYAGLLHRWNPQKQTGDQCGNAHDAQARKFLYDSALLNFELFLYRLYGEQDVWTHLLTQSIDSQRKVRQWKPNDEGRVLYFLANSLRSQKAYASMLREQPSNPRQCELQTLDIPKFQAQYAVVLTQAHAIDEALQRLKEDGAQLAKTVGALAYVWARWNLEAEDKFRQNEVLLIMSTLIYNTITILERHRASKTLSEAIHALFQPTCEYFFLLLLAVEWPNSWKTPLITRIQNLFPQLTKQSKEVVVKETILNHPLTQASRCPDTYESRPEPSQEFFDRHRQLYSWLMQSDEAVAREYVYSVAPSLREQRPSGG